MILLEKSQILTTLQKLPKNVGDLDKLIVAKGFKKLPKVQKIPKSGHTDNKEARQTRQVPIPGADLIQKFQCKFMLH